jgi:predicted secreted protein
MAVGTGENWKEEKAVKARVGGTVTIRLWEDRTRGEIYVPAYDSETLSLVNDDYERSFGDSNNAVDSGKRAFEFRALKPGAHRIVFEKRMGWKFTAEDRRVYVVTVAG